MPPTIHFDQDLMYWKTFVCIRWIQFTLFYVEISLIFFTLNFPGANFRFFNSLILYSKLTVFLYSTLSILKDLTFNYIHYYANRFRNFTNHFNSQPKKYSVHWNQIVIFFQAYLDCGCKETSLKCTKKYKIATFNSRIFKTPNK